MAFNAPTTAEIRALSKVEFSEINYPVETPDPLDPVVAQAIAYVEWMTGRVFDDTDDASKPSYGTFEQIGVLNSRLFVLFTQAVRMRTEQIAMQSQDDYVETASDDVVSSFSASDYSETRADPTRRGESKSINTWKALSDLLLILMTPDRYSWWLAYLSGTPQPAWSFSYELAPAHCYPGFATGLDGLGFDALACDSWYYAWMSAV
jgi:hypothetical protein